MSDIQQCQLCGADLVAGGSDINAELAKRDAEIERLRDHVKFLNSFRPDAELAKRDAEIERLRQQVTQRGARMQVMREWMMPNDWRHFVATKPEAAEWFDEDGVPR